MGDDGKLGFAPCGHVGRAVIGQYFACPICDVSDGVPEYVEPEVTKKLCPHCGGEDLEIFPGFTIFGKDLYMCHSCLRSHQRP